MKRVIPLLFVILLSLNISPVSAFSSSWLHREIYFNNDYSNFVGKVDVIWYAHDGFTKGMTGTVSFKISFFPRSNIYYILLRNVSFVLCESNCAPYPNGTLPVGHIYSQVSENLDIKIQEGQYASNQFVLNIPNNLSVQSADLHIILEIRVYQGQTYWNTLITSRTAERNIVSIGATPNLLVPLIYIVEVILIASGSGVILAGISLFITRKRR